MTLSLETLALVRRLVLGGLVVGSSSTAIAGLGACSAPCSPEDVAIPIDPKTRARLEARYGSERLPVAECRELCKPIGAGTGGGAPAHQDAYSWSGCSLITIETPGYAGPGVRCEGDFCPPVGIGRRPSNVRRAPGRGAPHLARAAAHEAAAAVAFVDLARDLVAHDAPSGLARRAIAGAFDEVRHARAMRTLALRHLVAPAPMTLGDTETPSLEALAIDNATEGLVFEAFGVDVLAHQSRHAASPSARRAFGLLARDEARHRDLARAIHAWASTRLGVSARRRVDEARRACRDRLAREVAIDERDRTLAGLPSEAERQRLLRAFDARMEGT